MLRAAIVGMGSWGQTLVASVQGKSEQLKFTAGYTRTPAKAEEFCRNHGIRMVGSYEEILADPEIDAVLLATPNSQHSAQVVQAAAAGKHVFCEKPFTLDRAGARTAIDAANKAAIVLAVGFNRRFHPSIVELRNRVHAGRFGVIASVIAELTATSAFYRPRESWRWSAVEEPAGAMAGIGVHLVDAMIDLVGPVGEVHCTSVQRAQGHGEDTTSLLLKFENGVTGLAFGSIAATRNFRLAVYGAKAFAEVLTPTMDTFRFLPAVEGKASHLAEVPQPETIEHRGVNTARLELEQFAQCVLDGSVYPVPLDDVYHGVCVFEAAVKSAASGLPVAVENMDICS
jgi:predicted dehydrogenase